MITYRSLIDAVLNRSSLESGLDTQTYSEVPVGQIVQSVFDTLFDMYWWPEYYTPYDPYVLDANGRASVTVTSKVKRWTDLRYVWYSTDQNALPRTPSRFNPTQLNRRSVMPDATNIFRVIPPIAGTAINIAYRTRPEPFKKDTDQILLDSEMMTLGCAYDYVNSIGLNPGAEDKLQEKFQNRIRQLMTNNDNMDAAVGNFDTSLLEWQER